MKIKLDITIDHGCVTGELMVRKSMNAHYTVNVAGYV